MKKFYLILFLILVGVVVYYFVPKTIKSCGSALPARCVEATCKTGFPLSSIGTSNITCLLGGTPAYTDIK